MSEVKLLIEVSRGSLIKRDELGRFEYLAPLPCPFSYGSVSGVSGEDGDELDGFVVGASPRRGETVSYPERGRVRFIDCGQRDDKLIIGPTPLTPQDLQRIRSFFVLVTLAKRFFYKLTRRPGVTRFEGVDPSP